MNSELWDLWAAIHRLEGLVEELRRSVYSDGK